LHTRPPIHEGSSNICLNARFATEPFRAVEVLDDLLPLTGAPVRLNFSLEVSRRSRLQKTSPRKATGRA
jgi:hypothetical protein